MIIKNTPPQPFTTPESFRECKTYLEQQGMPKYPFTSHQEQSWWYEKAWELGLGEIIEDNKIQLGLDQEQDVNV